MDNIRIRAVRKDYIIVKADTGRFGRNEVMFEGNTFSQCFDYIKRETGKKQLRLRSYMMDYVVTDREGRTFPWLMDVV